MAGLTIQRNRHETSCASDEAYSTRFRIENAIVEYACYILHVGNGLCLDEGKMSSVTRLTALSMVSSTSANPP